MRDKLRKIDPSPPAVFDAGCSPKDPLTYWLRKSDGAYIQLQRQDFCRQWKLLHPHSLEDPITLTEAYYITPKWIPDLTPGVYEDEIGAHHLVPKYIPRIHPPSMSDPPKEFQDLFKELKSLTSDNNPESTERKVAFQKRMVEFYKKRRRVVDSREPRRNFQAKMLRKSFLPDGFPQDENVRRFRRKDQYIWTSQPTGGYTEYLDYIIGFAAQFNLQVTISPNWSWYYPGRTVLIEWMRRLD